MKMTKAFLAVITRSIWNHKTWIEGHNFNLKQPLKEDGDYCENKSFFWTHLHLRDLKVDSRNFNPAWVWTESIPPSRAPIVTNELIWKKYDRFALFKLSTGLGGGITINRKIMNKYQPSGAAGTRSATAKAKSKMSASGPQNGRRGLERGPTQGYWPFQATFAN